MESSLLHNKHLSCEKRRWYPINNPRLGLGRIVKKLPKPFLFSEYVGLRISAFRKPLRSTSIAASVLSILPFYHYTILPFYQPTILPFYHSTILQLYHSTILPFYNFTNLPLYHCTIFYTPPLLFRLLGSNAPLAIEIGQSNEPLYAVDITSLSF